jgi:DNA invertase Pin-like site-specific DNA recombinase
VTNRSGTTAYFLRSLRISFNAARLSFNTTTSMGRLTLNVLLSFAQFEREVTGERIRDKIAASKKKGIWMGGVVPLGYRVDNRALSERDPAIDLQAAPSRETNRSSTLVISKKQSTST